MASVSSALKIASCNADILGTGRSTGRAVWGPPPGSPRPPLGAALSRPRLRIGIHPSAMVGMTVDALCGYMLVWMILWCIEGKVDEMYRVW
jgi:hypothetical protein